MPMQINSLCHCNIRYCTMYFKYIIQHLLLFLCFGKVNSSDIKGHTFNIEHEKRVIGHSTNIAIDTVSSIVHCAMNCAIQHACCSATFDVNTRSCGVNSQCSPKMEQYSDSMMITKVLSEGK